MIALDDLLLLLASHQDYESAACFARDFKFVVDPEAVVLVDEPTVYEYEVPSRRSRDDDGVARVRIWKAMGIVVVSRHPESYPGYLVDKERNPVRVSGGPIVAARCAEASLATSLVHGGAFALLRLRPNRNLPMLFSDGKWEVYDTSGDVHRNAIRCCKRLLWADVPPQKPPLIRLDLTQREADLLQQGLELVHRGMDDRGGAEVDALNEKLLELLEQGKPCGEAKMQSIAEAARPMPKESGGEKPVEHVAGRCPKCGSTNYGPDGEAMADACWDCGFIKEDQEEVPIKVAPQTPTMPHDREQPYPEFPVDPSNPEEPKS